MTDTRRYLTEEERAVFEKARRKSGKKVPKNYEGDGLRGYQAANLQQTIANAIRNERYQQDEAIHCAVELIAAKHPDKARNSPPLHETEKRSSDHEDSHQTKKRNVGTS